MTDLDLSLKSGMEFETAETGNAGKLRQF